MQLLVVSDLHITGPEDRLYRSLIAILSERARKGDTVVLAGDLFDLFVGDKPVFLQKYQEFFGAIKAACLKGVNVHYIEGNHDFLIRKAFEGIQGFSLHAHDVAFNLGDKRFFVAHGDTVDKADYGYRALRLFFRSPVMKAFVKVAPGHLIERIGRKSSQASSMAKPRTLAELPIERRECLRKAFRSYAAERLTEGYDFVVMGHCHDLDEMEFNIGGRKGQYVNVGYPRVHGSFLAWESGDPRIERVPLP